MDCIPVHPCSSVVPEAQDAKWMARALELARRGEALASPNPQVGAVLVKHGRAVGEGFHTYDGVKHAEILALEAAGRSARGATLYINLEPCCHTGRTGPCTDALIAAGIRRVVAGMRDPNPQVAGRGFAKLRRAGIGVDVGLMETEAKQLNESFARWIRTGLPFVTLKTAMSLDGKIAGPPRSRRGSVRGSVTWITSEESRAEVQRMRHASDALLTGIGTILVDDPRLTDRTGLPRRRPLLRVVLDSHLRLPLRSKMVQSANSDLLVFTTARIDSPKARKLQKAGVEIVRLRGRRPDLRDVMKQLGRRGIISVLIEPGAELARTAPEADVVDQVVMFIAPRVLGEGVGIEPGELIRTDTGEHHPMTVRRCGPDLVMEGYLHDVYR